MLCQLRIRFSPAVQSAQYRWTGERRSMIRWQREHSRSTTFSNSRDRVGRGSKISLALPPRERSKWPAPARGTHAYWFG